MNEPTKEQFIAYLFGEISGAERDAFEERLFAHADISDHLDEIEHDLIDAYVRNEMTAAERERFESRYLINERRRSKVIAARAISAKQGLEPTLTVVSEDRGFFASLGALLSPRRLAFAGSLALIAALGLFITWSLSNRGLDLVREDLTQTDNGPNDQKQVPLPVPGGPAGANVSGVNADLNQKRTEQKKKDDMRSSALAFTLLPMVRSGERPIFNVPSTASAIDLTVVHDNKDLFERYFVEVRNGGGRIVSSREIKLNATRVGRPVSVRIPANSIGSGVFELSLVGIASSGERSDIGFYEFSIEMK